MNDLEVLEQESTSMLDLARELQVTCDEEYSQAGEFVMGCKGLIKKITDAHQENIDRWHKGHKAAIADRDKNLLPVQRALEIVGGKDGTAMRYKREQDRLAREEADRIAAEKLKADEEERLREAERLEAEGKNKEAEEILEAPPPPAPRPTKFVTPVPKVAGLSTKKSWKARVVNPKAVKREFCEPWAASINGRVVNYFAWISNPTPEQIKAIEEEIGGIEVYEDERFAGRIAR